MTLVYPVQGGVAIRGAHGSYRAPARCSALSGFVCNSRLQFSGILPGRKNFGKTRHKMLQLVKQNCRENAGKKEEPQPRIGDKFLGIEVNLSPEWQLGSER